jgi:hypothetical protein
MGVGKLRSIPPDLWTDESLIELPLPVKWTAVGLRMHADDHGRQTVTDWMLRPSIWPGAGISEEELVDHLLALADVGYIGLYDAQGKTYYQVREWPSVSHPKRSDYPDPPPSLFQRAAGGSPEGRSAWEREGEGGEWGDEERPAGIPPSPFCPVHRPNGTRGNCRHCGTARLAQEDWIRTHEAGGDDEPF